MEVVSSLGSRKVGLIFEGRACFPIMVRIPEARRKETTLLEQLPVVDADKPIPLQELADITLNEKPPPSSAAAG